MITTKTFTYSHTIGFLAATGQPARNWWPALILGLAILLREPFGVVSAITGYNFPFLLNLAKIGPAAHTLAEAEGLQAHALSLALRLNGDGEN